jgi:hypothetical protein
MKAKQSGKRNNKPNNVNGSKNNIFTNEEEYKNVKVVADFFMSWKKHPILIKVQSKNTRKLYVSTPDLWFQHMYAFEFEDALLYAKIGEFPVTITEIKYNNSKNISAVSLMRNNGGKGTGKNFHH